MSYLNNLRLSLKDKLEPIEKISSHMCNESAEIAISTYLHSSLNGLVLDISYKEIREAAFLMLLTRNNQLTESEKEYCKEDFIYISELKDAVYKYGESRVCNKCKLTRYSNRFCENCISLHLQELFSSWTEMTLLIISFKNVKNFHL